MVVACTCHPNYEKRAKQENQGASFYSRANQNKTIWEAIWEITESKKYGGLTQVVEY
jgi:hypothetical protein